MKKAVRAAVVCCSNRRPKSERAKIQRLEQVLRGMGVIPVFGAQIYADEEVRPTGRERAEQLITYLSQLKQLGAFEQAAGILPGTFTTMEKEEGTSAVCELVLHFAGSGVPVAKTQEIGHGEDARAVVIGRNLELSGNPHPF